MLYTIGTGSMRQIQWYIGNRDSSKTCGAIPKDTNGGGDARQSTGFEYWGYRNVLYTIGTGSMGRIQWYIERFDSTEIRSATPKDAYGGGKASWCMGFSILELSHRALPH